MTLPEKIKIPEGKVIYDTSSGRIKFEAPNFAEKASPKELSVLGGIILAGCIYYLLKGLK